jgi:hypothetical protein
VICKGRYLHDGALRPCRRDAGEQKYCFSCAYAKGLTPRPPDVIESRLRSLVVSANRVLGRSKS